MQRTLLALALALSPSLALAQPPAQGTTHTFVDPTFLGTVFCDTYDEVLAIVTADQPLDVYRQLFNQRNDRNEPRCASIIPTGLVLSTTSLGLMERDGMHFQAWAVKTQVGSFTGFALYLEEVVIA